MPPSEAPALDSSLTDEEAAVESTWRDAADVGAEESGTAWAGAAREVLLGAARNYQSLVTYKELAAAVQEQTGIRSKQLMQHWIGDVLSRVAVTSHGHDEPLLSSLCVNADGSVGASYAKSIIALTGVAPDDGDDHAARERLACYQYFEAARLPADGGTAQLSPRLSAARSRARVIAARDRDIPTCPRCFIAVPSTGVCDDCG
jgi:hypothetical protein